MDVKRLEELAVWAKHCARDCDNEDDGTGASLYTDLARCAAALAAARKDADYWDSENGRMLELCRTKLGKRDVHGVADGIEQLASLLAEAREDGARLEAVESGRLGIQYRDGVKREDWKWSITYASTPIASGATLRAAIDAARGKP